MEGALKVIWFLTVISYEQRNCGKIVELIRNGWITLELASYQKIIVIIY